ncbi:hypothetical protein ACLBXM_12745 [Xanthobacteraceae bacterium A53D]
MKLSAEHIHLAAGQIDAQAVPETHPATVHLAQAFGDHTFFIDATGLSIVEPVTQAEAADPPSGQVVKIATWLDANRTQLVPQEPEYTDVIIDLAQAA